VVPAELVAEVLQQAQSEQPLECCGLLAGVREMRDAPIGRVLRRYPLVNQAASRVEFLSEPRSLLDAVRDIDRQGLEVLAIYHSHPTSAPIPSRTDLARNWSEDVVNVIVSLVTDPPTVRAWWLTAESYREAEWEQA
jgi:proteasome lid subunit RPN8/RPN11